MSEALIVDEAWWFLTSHLQEVQEARTEEAQLALLRKGRAGVREALASSPLIREATAWALLREGVTLRALLAHNPATPRSVVLELLGDVAEVRAGVVGHPELSEEEGEALFKDGNVQVRGRFLARGKVTLRQQWKTVERGELLNSLAWNPLLDDEVQAWLLEHALNEVRCGLSENPAVRTASAVALSFLDDEVVTDNLAHNQSVPLVREMSARVGAWTGARMQEVTALGAEEGVDPATLEALLPEWEGSIATLLEACRTLGPEVTRGV